MVVTAAVQVAVVVPGAVQVAMVVTAAVQVAVVVAASNDLKIQLYRISLHILYPQHRVACQKFLIMSF